MYTRCENLQRFYDLLTGLETRVREPTVLANPDALKDLPERGVYFFFEAEEIRRESGCGPRVVRVGTHALITGGRQTLRNRLATHRGTLKNGGGNHRGSVFRKIIGEAILRRGDWRGAVTETWGKDQSASREVRQAELLLEQAVSRYIRQMPFLCLPILDPPGPVTLRRYIERNSIALLSNYFHPEGEWIDPPSAGWLGRSHGNERISRSGLWNSNHVDERYDPGFLEVMRRLVGA